MADYATLLRDHVTLKCRSIDRIFLQAYVPKLQSVGQVCIFLRWQRKFKFPSSVAFGQIGEAYVKAIHKFAESQGIPVVHFQKGQDKEELARPYLEAAAREGKDRVVLIGIARRKLLPGDRGRAEDSGKASARTSSGAARWSLSITSTSNFGTPNGVGRSGRPTPVLPFLSGSGSTATNGPSASWQEPESVMGLWITASVPVPTPQPCRRFVTGWVQQRSKASSGAGCAVCPRRLLWLTCEPATFTSWPFANLRPPTRVCSTGRKRAGCGLKG